MRSIPFFENASLVASNIGLNVGVYRNLHNQSFSVIDRKKRIVLFHTKSLILKSALFHVREGGWQSVIDTGTKNVHAFVYGIISEPQNICDTKLHEVTYRPKISSFFHRTIADKEIEKVFISDYVKMFNGKTILAKIDCESA